jgi:hypothetical protein
VNPGPGPKQHEDLVQRMDLLFTELRDTKDTLAKKIDDSVNIISARLKTCEDFVASYGARLGDVERAQHTMEAQIATLQASLSAPRAPAPAAAPAVTATSLSDVIHELDLRASKKTNIVLSGVLPAPPVSDATLATNLLRDELGINATVTRCVR